jgi:hypothetical protein
MLFCLDSTYCLAAVVDAIDSFSDTVPEGSGFRNDRAS